MTGPSSHARGGGRALRVLLVASDERARGALAGAVEPDARVEVVGCAGSPAAGLRLALELRPDCICLELPARPLEGLALVRLLMRAQPTPVLVIAGPGVRKPHAFKALAVGALDVLTAREGENGRRALALELRARLETVRALALRDAAPTPPPRTPPPAARAAVAPARVAVLGASTGGPSALVQLLATVPPRLPLAWAVAQHMPERFTASFADRLARTTGLDVREARDGDELAEGRVLVAPGGRHLRIVRAGAALRAAVTAPEPSDGPRYCPSVDLLFSSAAEACGAGLCAVVLTGMGDDGRRGVARVKEAGGLALAESETSAVVYGMPRHAAESGLVDEVLPLEDIVRRLRRFAEVGR